MKSWPYFLQIHRHLSAFLSFPILPHVRLPGLHLVRRSQRLVHRLCRYLRRQPPSLPLVLLQSALSQTGQTTSVAKGWANSRKLQKEHLKMSIVWRHQWHKLCVSITSQKFLRTFLTFIWLYWGNFLKVAITDHIARSKLFSYVNFKLLM